MYHSITETREYTEKYISLLDCKNHTDLNDCSIFFYPRITNLHSILEKFMIKCVNSSYTGLFLFFFVKFFKNFLIIYITEIFL